MDNKFLTYVLRNPEQYTEGERRAVADTAAKRIEELSGALAEFMKADANYFNAPDGHFDSIMADDRLIAARKTAREALIKARGE